MFSAEDVLNMDKIAVGIMLWTLGHKIAQIKGENFPHKNAPILQARINAGALARFESSEGKIDSDILAACKEASTLTKDRDDLLKIAASFLHAKGSERSSYEDAITQIETLIQRDLKTDTGYESGSTTSSSRSTSPSTSTVGSRNSSPTNSDI